MTTRSILNRGSFLASVAGLAILPLHARAAAKYACPPCGCASDGLLFDRPGPCPSCGMALVASAELQHSVERAQFPPGVDRVQSPFELLSNAIYFPVLVNDKGPYLFALDTGSFNSVVAAEVSHELGIKTGTAYRGVGAGSDSSPAATIESLEFTLAKGVTRSTRQAGVVAMAGLWPLIGKRFYGDVGHDILRSFVVKIDYQKQLLTLHDPASYQYTGSGTTLPTHLFAAYDPQIDGEL